MGSSLADMISKAFNKQHLDLLKEINTSDNLDKYTKQELLSMYSRSGGYFTDFTKARNIFDEAIEGVKPKYKARRGTEEYLKLKGDMPGIQVQTRTQTAPTLATGLSNMFSSRGKVS